MSWEIGHPLKRDGTSQRQRPSAELLPENNPIDPRTVEDGLIYAYQLAEKISFYNSQDNLDGNWQAFFPGTDPKVIDELLRERKTEVEKNVEPQLALFLAFLKLLDLLKQDLNGLTQKHLNFYYEEVLGFKRKTPKPDQVHVLFELAKQKDLERVEAGTVLLAGKDAEKKPLYYRLKNELIVNSARVKSVGSIKGGEADLAKIIKYSVPFNLPFSPFGERSLDSNLLIGFENLANVKKLKLNVKVEENSIKPKEGLSKEDVFWYVRIKNEWKPIPREQLTDNTNGLQETGDITFSFENNLQPDNLTKGWYWIRANTSKNAANAISLVNLIDLNQNPIIKYVATIKGGEADPAKATAITLHGNLFRPFGDNNLDSNLLIGIENFSPDTQLNLLFQVLEGTAILQEGLSPSDVNWYIYKDDNKNPKNYTWTRISGASIIISDTTLGLQQSGIISFAFSGDLQPTKFKDGLYWIKASIVKDPNNAPRMIDIQTQAGIAEFEDRENSQSHLEKGLAANAIKNLNIRNASISKINQPYPSFAGKPAEKDTSFFARVSERLRHKQRAVTIWDYEHLVLCAFDQEVYKVKAINHAQRKSSYDYSEFRPGHIEIVLIPLIRNVSQGIVLEPNASSALQDRIRIYLEQYCSPHVSLSVSNPIYEQITLDFSVGFRVGYDAKFYQTILNDTIKKHLSPWAFEEGADIAFGGRIYRSQLLAFIEGLHYVDYVTDFKLKQTIVAPDYNFGTKSSEVEVAEASTAASILISAKDHTIKTLAPGDYTCADSALCDDGIGCMIIDIDFIVGKL